MKSYLKLEVVWRDDDMFELEVTASNGRFSGTTTVYVGSNCMASFADSLKGFPQASDSILNYECGRRGGYSYFSMRFYTIDSVGHLGVQVALESNVPTEYRQEMKDKMALEILTEPGLLDNFMRQLATLAKMEEGQAILEGLS